MQVDSYLSKLELIKSLNEQEPLLSNTTVLMFDLRQVTYPHGAHFPSFKIVLIIYIQPDNVYRCLCETWMKGPIYI